MIIQGRNLFPLSLIVSPASGYFMDADGVIWSQRYKAGQLVRLHGSQSTSGRLYITIQNDRPASGSRSHDHSQLLRVAKAHPAWHNHTVTLAATANVTKTDLATALGLKAAPAFGSQTVLPLKVEPVKAARPFSPDIDTAIANRGFIIGAVGVTGLSFSTRPHIHPTEHVANTELERLAKLNPGTTYVKLQIKGAATVQEVTQRVTTQAMKWK